MNTDYAVDGQMCPDCGHRLTHLGAQSLLGLGLTHVYLCAAGCRGPHGDGRYEYAECPCCHSHDTSTSPPADSLEEIACHACGTVSRITIA
jgi:hypothetical protein